MKDTWNKNKLDSPKKSVSRKFATKNFHSMRTDFLSNTLMPQIPQGDTNTLSFESKYHDSWLYGGGIVIYIFG